ncbi:MAG: hypothetical protein RJA70_2136, partial [Pseudomonadota bacterium]
MLSSLQPPQRLCALLIAFGLLLSTRSQAQTIDPVTNTAFSRDREDERPGTGTKRPYSISLDDCVQGDVLHFDLKVSSPSSDNFQVWVGSSDCTQEQERENTTAQCWLVHSAPAEEISFTVDIPV